MFKTHQVSSWATRRVEGTKVRAHGKGLGHNLTESHLVKKLTSRCPVLGIRMDLSDDPEAPSYPTIDRKDNHRGYERDNIQVISRKANELKDDYSREEVGFIVEEIKKGTTIIKDGSRLTHLDGRYGAPINPRTLKSHRLYKLNVAIRSKKLDEYSAIYNKAF